MQVEIAALQSECEAAREALAEAEQRRQQSEDGIVSLQAEVASLCGDPTAARKDLARMGKGAK
jgi:hypothetical protein